MHLQMFSTANDQNSVRVNWFHHPFMARYVRIHPQSWQGKPCLRFDLYGCSIGRYLFIVALKTNTFQTEKSYEKKGKRSKRQLHVYTKAHERKTYHINHC